MPLIQWDLNLQESVTPPVGPTIGLNIDAIILDAIPPINEVDFVPNWLRIERCRYMAFVWNATGSLIPTQQALVNRIADVRLSERELIRLVDEVKRVFMAPKNIYRGGQFVTFVNAKGVAVSYKIKQGDLEPPIEAILTSTTPGLVASALSVEFRYKIHGSIDPVTVKSAELVNVASGRVRYTWQAGDTDVVGVYDAEWKLTFTGGRTATFPSDGEASFEIEAHL